MMDLRLLALVAIIAVPVVAYRAGKPSEDAACDRRPTRVPAHVRYFVPHQFYQKYTHAYGIPILGSYQVSDAAFKRACYMLKFLLADNYRIRYYMYRNKARYGIIGTREHTTSIPEHAFLGSGWNARARGLGGTMRVPISTGGEENLLCLQNDRYRVEDIGLHEFIHGLVNTGAVQAIPGIREEIKAAYNRARYSGLWARTYAMSTWEEYIAEGAQSFFNVNAYKNPADGIHNHVSTRAQLRTYDPTLYRLVVKIFPCMNTYKKRCATQNVRTTYRKDCASGRAKTMIDEANGKTTTVGGGGTGTGGGGATTARPIATPQPSGCVDKNTNCAGWARGGHCTSNAQYMKPNCCKSCKDFGGGGTTGGCTDKDRYCASWAVSGYCTSSKTWMSQNCCKSCRNAPKGNCKDDNISCPSWESRGECDRNPLYMHKSCKKSCGKC